MKKEPLKLQNITQDLIQVIKYNIRYLRTIIIIIPILLIFIPALINGQFILSVICIPALIFTIVYPIYYVIISNKRLSAINNGEFTVTVEYVQNKKCFVTGAAKGTSHLNYRFYLSDGSVFKMSDFGTYDHSRDQHTYYKWSEYGEISVDGIFKTAEIGDKLYVVHIGKKRNVMCYNAKQFEPYGFTVEDSHAAPSQDGENSPE